MTKRAAWSLLALAALLVGAAGRPTAQDDKGASLLAEARRAIGGEEKLRGVKTVQAKGTFRRGAGGTTLEGDFEISIEVPAKYKRHEETGVAGGPIGERTEVLNGIETWEDVSNGFPAGRGFFGRGRFDGGASGGAPDRDGVRRGAGGRAGQPMDPEVLKEAQRRQRQAELSRLLLAWFLATDAPVSWVGTAESPDGKADVVEVRPAEGAPTRVFLDEATHMPLMMTTTGGGRGRRGGVPGGARSEGSRGRGPGPITIETHLSEYKTVGGIRLPHLITRGVNGQATEELVIKSYRLNPNFKANTFTR